jgi:5-methyltetrahydrofolate--homocysteine methyltransferase
MAIGDVYQAVLEFDRDRVVSLVESELDAGTDLRSLLDDGLVKPLDEIGRQFSDGTAFVPEMLATARAMKAGLEVLRPHLSEGRNEPAGRVVLGTVKGDLHDIGKNLVGMMLDGAGFEVVDLGVDVDAGGFIEAARSHDADVVGLSCLVTTTMPAMAAAVATIKEQAAGAQVIVGGAPVNQAFCDRAGADGYGNDAASAVVLVRRILADRPDRPVPSPERG